MEYITNSFENLYQNIGIKVKEKTYFSETKVWSSSYVLNEIIDEENVIEHLHCEWINFYEKNYINQISDMESMLNVLSKCDFSNEINDSFLIAMENTIKEYMDEMDSYYKAANPSIDSLINTLKYVSFLTCYKPKFYIDATTGYFGCTVKKKKSSRKKKSLNLIFKPNDEVIFSLTERLNNIITITGVADFEDNLNDAKALRYLLEL